MNAAAPRTARKRRARWAVIALVVIGLIATAVAFPLIAGGKKNQAPPIATTAARTGTLVVTASADGQTEADESFDVYANVSGTVATVEVAVGDTVAAGDTLFVVDDADLQTAARSATAQVSQAHQQVAQANQQVAQANQQLDQAQLTQLRAENNLDALESLTGTQTASSARIAEAKDEVGVAKAGVAAAQAGVKSANAALSSAKVARSNAQKSLAEANADLAKVVVTAPASGVVTSLGIAEGGTVTTGGGTSMASSGGSSAASAGSSAGGSAAGSASAGSSAPVVISQDADLVAVVAVNEVDIADIAAGQQALVTFDAESGLEITGTVSWISPNAVTSGNVRTYDVELRLGEQNDRLRPGMTTTANIVTLTITDTLLVPKTAVRVDGSTKFVTVVKPDGSQEKRTVTTGRSDETDVQILSGLEVNEKVATTFTAPQETSGGGFMPPRPPSGMGGN